MLQLLSENNLTILKTVEYMEAHDKLKCIGHPLPRFGTDGLLMWIAYQKRKSQPKTHTNNQKRQHEAKSFRR